MEIQVHAVSRLLKMHILSPPLERLGYKPTFLTEVKLRQMILGQAFCRPDFTEHYYCCSDRHRNVTTRGLRP